LGGFLQDLVELRVRTIDGPKETLGRARGAVRQRGEALDAQPGQLEDLLERLALPVVTFDQLHRPRSRRGWSHGPSAIPFYLFQASGCPSGMGRGAFFGGGPGRGGGTGSVAARVRTPHRRRRRRSPPPC